MPWRILVLSLRAPLVHQLLYSTSNVSSSESESEEEIEVSPSKAHSSSKPVLPKKRSKSRSTSSTRKYIKIWEEDYPWLHCDTNWEGAFCKICKASGKSLYHTGGVWTTKTFTNWKKAHYRMRDHARRLNDIHIQASEAALATQGRFVDIVQQLNKSGNARENEEKGCCQINDLLYSLSRPPTY